MVKPTKRSIRSNSSMEKSKFAVYDFSVDDDRVEQDSQKMLSKFKSRNPIEPSTSPVDKYTFLSAFARGAKTVGNASDNEPLDVDDYYADKEERIHQLDAAVSNPSDCEELAHSPADIHDSACSFSGEISCTQKGRKLGGCVNDDGHLHCLASNQPLCIDSDDEQEKKESLQSGPICVDSDDDLRNAESVLVKEQRSNHDSSAHESESDSDSELTVVVKPDCIILGNMYSTASTLTFSRRSIKLEGSIVDQTSRSFHFNLPISDIVKFRCLWFREIETVSVDLYLKYGDDKVTEIGGSSSEITGTLLLNFSINDPEWCERQEAITSLDSRYKATLETVLNVDPISSEFSSLQQKCMSISEDCSSIDAFEEVIYPEGDPDAVYISKKDIERLQPSAFINDTIIDFYVKYLRQNIKPDQRHRFHFFNSFFFRKLADLDKDPSTACEGRAAFQRVHKWTRKVDLFEKDFLFIPVNFSLHWSLIVVCHPGEAACFKNEGAEKASKVPCILHMDSIRGYHRGLKNLFQSYLWEEWKERHSDLSEDVHTNFLNMPFISLTLPQQGNSFDCGLFLLHYVECFLQQAPLNFNPYSESSDFLNGEWFQPAEASNRRGYIKSLIYQIYHENAKKHSANDGDETSSNKVVEDNIGKGFLLEACDGREADRTDYLCVNTEKQKIQKAAQVTTPRQSCLYLDGPESIHEDLSGQRARGTNQHQEKMVSLDQRCNLLSPIMEELGSSAEQTVPSSTHKVGFRNAAATVSGVPINLDYEDVENFTGNAKILPGEFAPEVVILVSASEEKTGKKNKESSMFNDEFECCVVEDSQEESRMIVSDDDVADSHIREVRRIDIVDIESDHPCTRKDEKGYNKKKSVETSEVAKNFKNLSQRFPCIREKDFYS